MATGDRTIDGTEADILRCATLVLPYPEQAKHAHLLHTKSCPLSPSTTVKNDVVPCASSNSTFTSVEPTAWRSCDSSLGSAQSSPIEQLGNRSSDQRSDFTLSTKVLYSASRQSCFHEHLQQHQSYTSTPDATLHHTRSPLRTPEHYFLAEAQLTRLGTTIELTRPFPEEFPYRLKPS